MGWTLVLVLVLGAVDLGHPVSACLPPLFPLILTVGKEVRCLVHTSVSGPSIGSLPMRHLYYGGAPKPECREFHLIYLISDSITLVARRRDNKDPFSGHLFTELKTYTGQAVLE